MNCTIMFPVYNEEKRLENGVRKTVEFLKEHSLGYNLVIIDNGSTDATESIGEELEKEFPNVTYCKINEKGVGAAFRKGFEISDTEVFGYMDVDLSTKLEHLLQVEDIFKKDESVQIVNGSRISKGSQVIGRKLGREITSRGLNIILKIFFRMKIKDSLCGFKFFKRDSLDCLMKQSSGENGWFYIVELLLRAERGKYKIEEIPVVWEDDYNTTVKVFKLIIEYLRQIMRLFIMFNFKGEKK